MLDKRNTERHEMILQETHAGGAEEWYCPTCGRRFLMQWPPNFKRIVLECGDENAIHTGSKGGDPSERAVDRQSSKSRFADEWQTAIDEIDYVDGDESESEYTWDSDPYGPGLDDDVDGFASFDFTSFHADEEESGLSVAMMQALEELDFTVLDRFDEE